MSRSSRFHDALHIGIRAVVAVGSCLPLGLTRRTCVGLSSAVLRLSRRDRQRAWEHLIVAFPERSDSERRALLGASARHFGATLAEILWLFRASPAQVEGLCTITGVEHLTSALDEGRGVMLVTAHAGNWELLNARLCVAGIPMTIAVRDLYDPRVDRTVTRLRTRFGAEVVHRGPAAGRQLFRALARNRVTGLLIDQDIRDVPGVFVPFFGRAAWTPSGAATLALRAGCKVVPAFIHRLSNGQHHAEVLPPLPPIDGSDDGEHAVWELTAAATAAIETRIRAHPEQWVWMHRRWRHQPEPSDVEG